MEAKNAEVAQSRSHQVSELVSAERMTVTRLVYYVMTGRTNTEKIENSALKEFVNRGLSSDKKKRFQDIDELISAFNSIQE